MISLEEFGTLMEEYEYEFFNSWPKLVSPIRCSYNKYDIKNGTLLYSMGVEKNDNDEFVQRVIDFKGDRCLSIPVPKCKINPSIFFLDSPVDCKIVQSIDHYGNLDNQISYTVRMKLNESNVTIGINLPKKTVNYYDNKNNIIDSYHMMDDGTANMDKKLAHVHAIEDTVERYTVITDDIFSNTISVLKNDSELNIKYLISRSIESYNGKMITNFVLNDQDYIVSYNKKNLISSIKRVSDKKQFAHIYEKNTEDQYEYRSCYPMIIADNEELYKYEFGKIWVEDTYHKTINNIDCIERKLFLIDENKMKAFEDSLKKDRLS